MIPRGVWQNDSRRCGVHPDQIGEAKTDWCLSLSLKKKKKEWENNCLELEKSR